MLRRKVRKNFSTDEWFIRTTKPRRVTTGAAAFIVILLSFFYFRTA